MEDSTFFTLFHTFQSAFKNLDLIFGDDTLELPQREAEKAIEVSTQLEEKSTEKAKREEGKNRPEEIKRKQREKEHQEKIRYEKEEKIVDPALSQEIVSFENMQRSVNEELLKHNPSTSVPLAPAPPETVKKLPPEEQRNEELRRYYLKSIHSAIKPSPTIQEKEKKIEECTFDSNDTQRDKELKTVANILTSVFDEEGVDFQIGESTDSSDIKILDSRPTEAMIVSLEFTNDFIQGHTFEELSKNEKLRKEKELEVRKGVASALDVPISEVVVVGIKRGSVKIETVIPQNVFNRMSSKDKETQKFIFDAKEAVAKQFQQSHPNVFKSATATVKNIKDALQLTPGDFDKRGDFSFPTPGGEMQKRGGQDYYQPSSKWKRYGFRVLGLYENDDWIKMDGREGEWVAAFHGPSGNLGVATSIAKSRTLVKGTANAYAGRSSVNGKGVIPKGIYFARDVEKCYKTAVKIGGERYELAFQCRIHPDHIWDTGNGSTWVVVDESRFIRPYGIVVKKL